MQLIDVRDAHLLRDGTSARKCRRHVLYRRPFPSADPGRVNAMGIVAETDLAACDDFYPGWEEMFKKIGRERGFSQPNRAQFDAMRSPHGAFLIGSPETVVDRILAADKALGGISRLTFQMSTASLSTEAVQRSITLLGQKVAPAVRAALA